MTKVSAKKPKTMVGTPASISRIGLTILRTRGGRVLGEVDRAQQAERDRDEQADAGQVERPPDDRDDAEGLLVAAQQRRPLVAEQVVADRDVAEEGDRLAQQREDDQDRRDDGQHRRHEERDLDRRLPAGTHGGAGPGWSGPPRRRGGRSRLRGRAWGSVLPPSLQPWCRSLLALVACSSVSGTMFAALAIVGLVGEDEVHERLDLGALDRLLARVHEQRARERLVGAVLDRLGARLDAAALVLVDADQVELVRVLLVVGEAEVAEAALVAGDAGDELVVVLGGLVVLAGHALLAVDLVGEEVERARSRCPARRGRAAASGSEGSTS